MSLRILSLVVAVMTIAGVVTINAAEPRTNEANAAVEYITSLQNPDGGFPAFGTESSPSASLDAAIALVSSGKDAASVATPGGATLGEYLSVQVPPEDDPGAFAKLSFGLSVMGLDGARFTSQMRAFITPGMDSYGDDLFDEAFYVFALAAADEPRPASAAYLRSVQLADGGWEFAEGFGGDSNTTAMVLQALLAAGGTRDEPATEDALSYLASTQNVDGGFGFAASDDSDPNSTALVIQALVAAGEDIDAGGLWDRAGHTPLDGLMSFYNAATGAFQYAGGDSAFATYQGIPALMLAPFPRLESLPDGEPPTPTPTPSPSPYFSDFRPTATPQFTLPQTGSGPRGASPIILILGIGGVGLSAVVVAGSKRRS
jgi:hypothetical protein